jgi:hypothetical protein
MDEHLKEKEVETTKQKGKTRKNPTGLNFKP